MKKKILLLTIIAAIGTTWFLLADKFQQAVTEQYLPWLRVQKDRGLIDFDISSIKINQYQFKVVIDNFSFDVTGKDITKIDQISVCYNPLTDNITIYTSGQKLSTGSGDDETYVINPKESIKINRALLDYKFDKIKIYCSSKKFDLLLSSTDKVISSYGDGYTSLIGKLDSTTNQYSFEIESERDSLEVTPEFTKYLQNMAIKYESFYENPVVQKKLVDFVTSSADYSYNISTLSGPTSQKLKLSANFDKKYLENLILVFKGELTSKALFKEFRINKEIFALSFNGSRFNRDASNQIIFNLSGNNGDLKGGISINGKNNYSSKQISEITNFTSEFLLQIFHEFEFESAMNLVTEDLNPLVNIFMHIKNSQITADINYKLANESFDSDLKIEINDYKMNLTTRGQDDKFIGTFYLSNPAEMIKAKNLLTTEVIIPLFQKTKEGIEYVPMLQKANSNLETNGFGALKALSNKSDMREGDNFEANFVFEPDAFELRINDKSALNILTDERVVKFLKGMED